MGRFGTTLAHAWNLFRSQDQDLGFSKSSGGVASSHRQDRAMYRPGNERVIIASIYTRIAVDCAAIDLRHVRLDEDERYVETIYSGLQECLSTEANLDQTGRSMIQDAVYSMCDIGDIAIVPVETDLSPNKTGGFDIRNLRVGRVVGWDASHVRIDLYNEWTGQHQQITMDKRQVALVENPLGTVMNEPNSILQRILRKLAELDAVETQAASGKMDLIIQFPYTVMSDKKRETASQRVKDIEFQLSGSKYGVAWADANEKITQLNRPVENNMLKTIEYLMNMLYGQLGITAAVMDGTADELTMLNYYNRTIEPILGALAGEMKRKFLTKTARTQRQSIEYYRDPFKLVTMKDLAEIGDKFTRNEIASSNDMRQAIGWKPSKDPKANELRNSNMPDPNVVPGEVVSVEDEDDGLLSSLEQTMTELESIVGAGSDAGG